MGYGKGGKESRDDGRYNKRDDKKEESKANYQHIADETFLERVIKNFDSYVNAKKLAAEIDPDEEPEEEEADEGAKGAHSFETFKILIEKNGRKGQEIIVALAQGVLCDKEPKVIKNYFRDYINLIITERHLNARDFSDGVSKVIQMMPELQMDCPTIYRLLFENVIVPLEKVLDMKKIRWVDNSKKG